MEKQQDWLTFRVKKTHLAFLVIALLCFSGGYGVGYLQWRPVTLSEGDEVAAAGATQSNQPGVVTPTSESVEDPKGPMRLSISVDDDPSIGSANAPVTIVEFSDYECPFCKRFFDETFSQLLSAFEGKVHYVFRDFPLTGIHPRAQRAAEAANCAGDQNQYWPMHDLLFSQQASWKNFTVPDEQFVEFAGQLGLNTDVFKSCLDAETHAAEVRADMNAGMAYGVNGTPTFFINGRPLVGAVPLEMFKAVIEAELNS